MPHPLVLPPALHAIGMAAALIVAGLALRKAIRRARSGAAAVEAAAIAVRIAVLRPRPRKPMAPRRPVERRAHFGLRGLAQ